MIRTTVARREAVRRLSLGFTAFSSFVVALFLLAASGAHVSAPVRFSLVVPLLVYLLLSVRQESGGSSSSLPRVLILGKNRLADILSREIAKVVRNDGSGPPPENPIFSSPNRADTEDPKQLREFILREGISQVVIADPNLEDQAELAEMLLECKFRGVQIQDAHDFYEELNKKVWLESLQPEWFIFSKGFKLSWRKTFFKRLFDLFLAVFLLVLLAPLMLLVALAIKLGSPGPVLFKQTRIGQFGVPFTIYKFRSMREDAEESSGPVWASQDDERVTYLGNFLRRTHLDELPQVLNVLRNDLSFVGPRPERPEFVEQLDRAIPFYELRHYAKPGITGWAQVSFPYGGSVEAAYEKLQYDLYYAKHASFRFEGKILLATVRQVLTGGGDSHDSHR